MIWMCWIMYLNLEPNLRILKHFPIVYYTSCPLFHPKKFRLLIFIAIRIWQSRETEVLTNDQLGQTSPWNRRIKVYEKGGLWDRNLSRQPLTMWKGREGRERRDGGREGISDGCKSWVTQGCSPSSFPNTGCLGTRLQLPCFRIMKEAMCGDAWQ